MSVINTIQLAEIGFQLAEMDPQLAETRLQLAENGSQLAEKTLQVAEKFPQVQCFQEVNEITIAFEKIMPGTTVLDGYMRQNQPR